MPNIIALRVIAILVLLPSTLVASFWSLFGVVFVVDALERNDRVASGIVLLAAMAAGWFGLITTWRLYYGFLHGRPSLNLRVAWLGLICGSLTSTGLIATTGGSLAFRIAFIGWPLLGAAFFAMALWRLPMQPNNSCMDSPVKS